MVIERYDIDDKDDEADLPTLSVGASGLSTYRGHVHLRYHGYRYIHIR
jgi:hypothetical protein